MSSDEPGDAALPSIFDRLLDEDPESSRDRPKSHAQKLRDLRESVLRDVRNLLNTRRRASPPPPELAELRPSLADYGVPDFLGKDLAGSTGREEVRRAVEEALRVYEPRFRSLRVDVLANSDDMDRMLRFRIDALLHAEPAPEPVVFDSVVDPVDGSFDVEGSPDA